MAIRTRAVLTVVIALVCITGLNCKNTQRNSNAAAANTTGITKPGRWIAQYRSPSLASYPEGTNPAEAVYYSSISVVSPNVVFVAGDMKDVTNPDLRVPVFVRTNDGGKTWTEKTLQAPNIQIQTIQNMHFVSPQTGWLIGLNSAEEGVLLKTTDGGDSWTAMRLPFNQFPAAIFFVDENTGWIGGQGPPITEDGEEEGPSDITITSDGGQTWSSQIRLPVSIYDIFFINNMTGWAVGSLGAIYHTSDGGKSWATQRSELELISGAPNPASEGIKRFKMRAVQFVDASHGFAAAESGTDTIGRMLTTSDGGATWSKRWSPPDAGLIDVHFLSPQVGWGIKEEVRYIYLTLDGGVKWYTEPKDFEVQIARLASADASHVWAVGAATIFFRSAN
jgi:photosystem II stability/assembly factor-like uncharacterized protein